MKPKDTKHLQLRHNTWWFWYRIPKKLKAHPIYADAPALYTQSLGTDSLKDARRLRDTIINNLWSAIGDDQHEAWEKEILARSAQFSKDNPHIDGQVTYRDVLLDSLIDDQNKQTLTDTQKVQLDVITGRKPDKQKLLRTVAAKVIEERTANGQAAQTVFKIRRSVDWFIEHLVTDDIDISLIDYDQVHSFIVQDIDAGLAGSTLNGYLYGLRQVWDRAKQSKLVTGDNPFGSHKVSRDGDSYDPFTYEEIYAMYQAAEGELKTLVHAGATTGARIGELLTAEVKTPSTYDHPCWLFKFKDRGKTAQSTRVVPLHPSLTLPEGFKFTILSRTAGRQFRSLVKSTITNATNELTGEPRKLSFHSFRTTVISELVGNKRIDSKVVGAVSGHLAGDPSLGSIPRYINAEDLAGKQRTVNELPWMIDHSTD